MSAIFAFWLIPATGGFIAGRIVRRRRLAATAVALGTLAIAGLLLFFPIEVWQVVGGRRAVVFTARPTENVVASRFG